MKNGSEHQEFVSSINAATWQTATQFDPVPEFAWDIIRGVPICAITSQPTRITASL